MKLIVKEKFEDLERLGKSLTRSGLCVTVCDARQEFNEEVAFYLLKWLKKYVTEYKRPFKLGNEIYEPLDVTLKRIISSLLIMNRRYVRETLHVMLQNPFETTQELKERLSKSESDIGSSYYGRMLYYFFDYDVKLWKSLRKDVHEFLLTTMINFTDTSKKNLGKGLLYKYLWQL
jgi:hypothetical protein